MDEVWGEVSFDEHDMTSAVQTQRVGTCAQFSEVPNAEFAATAARLMAHAMVGVRRAFRYFPAYMEEYKRVGDKVAINAEFQVAELMPGEWLKHLQYTTPAYVAKLRALTKIEDGTIPDAIYAEMRALDDVEQDEAGQIQADIAAKVLPLILELQAEAVA